MSTVQLSSAALERLAARRTFPLQRRTGVCRCLFGPVDHDELRRDAAARLREICERDRQRWNFNFVADAPLEGDYAWEAVPAEETPGFYRDSGGGGGGGGGPPRPDVQDRLAAPCVIEVNQENRTDKINSGKGTRADVPCVRRRRASTTDSNTHITDFFVKRRRAADRTPVEPGPCLPPKAAIPVEQTPRKRIR